MQAQHASPSLKLIEILNFKQIKLLNITITKAVVLQLHDSSSRYKYVAIFYSVGVFFGLYYFHLEDYLRIESLSCVMKRTNICI